MQLKDGDIEAVFTTFKSKFKKTEVIEDKKNNLKLDVNIQDAPKDLVDNLSAQLKKLHDSLENVSLSTRLVEKSITIKLDDLGVSIEIIMKCQGIPSPGPATCLAKYRSDTAVVQIAPENEQVLKAVAAYFKNQLYSRGSNMPLFDRVEINGKELVIGHNVGQKHKKAFSNSPIKEAENFCKTVLMEGAAGSKIRVSVNEPFSIELSHSASTGHRPWEIIQSPAFITIMKEKNYSSPDHQGEDFPPEGSGHTYGYVFKPTEAGEGEIIMKLPCSFDDKRSVEKRFTIIAS